MSDLKQCPPDINLVKTQPDIERRYTNEALRALARCIGEHMIPDPAGHGGEFLSTDGTTFFWATAGGGSILIAGNNVELDTTTTPGSTIVNVPADGTFFGDQLGSLGSLHAAGTVTTDFTFDFATNGARQSVTLSAPTTYAIDCTNTVGSGLHQVAITNSSGMSIIPTWGSRFDFGAAGPPVIPDGVTCTINMLWDSTDASLRCVHNCPASSSIHYRRDDLEADGGETVISTTQDIYSDSLELYLDGSIIPLADYVRTGSRIATLDTPTSSGEVYTVRFWSSTPVTSPSVWLIPLAVSGAWTDTSVGSPLGGSPRAISGGAAPYSVALQSGTRPAGVTISVAGATLVATGNTTTVGTYSWTDRVTSSDGQHYDVVCNVVVAAFTAKYWRIYVTQAAQPSNVYCSVAEMELALTPGGADQCSGGTATADSQYSGTYSAAKAFDNNLTTQWVSASGYPHWLAYELPSAMAIVELRLTSPGASYGVTSENPSDFLIQYSSDGISWTTARTVTNVLAWGLGVTKTWSIP